MFTSISPIRSAEALDDAMLDKMLSKAAKLLTNALFSHGYKVDSKQTKFVKSDFSLWTASNYKNYMWMLDFFISVRDERHLRFPDLKEHKDWELLCLFVHWRGKIPKTNPKLDAFPNITEYKDSSATVCYRKWLEDTWNNAEEIPEWTLRGPPIWSWRNDINIDKLEETSYNYLEV